MKKVLTKKTTKVHTPKSESSVRSAKLKIVAFFLIGFFTLVACQDDEVRLTVSDEQNQNKTTLDNITSFMELVQNEMQTALRYMQQDELNYIKNGGKRKIVIEDKPIDHYAGVYELVRNERTGDVMITNFHWASRILDHFFKNNKHAWIEEAFGERVSILWAKESVYVVTCSGGSQNGKVTKCNNSSQALAASCAANAVNECIKGGGCGTVCSGGLQALKKTPYEEEDFVLPAYMPASLVGVLKSKQSAFLARYQEGDVLTSVRVAYLPEPLYYENYLPELPPAH